MYEVISYLQKTRWEDKLNQLSETDIFYHPSYSSLYRDMGDGDPFLFFYENGAGNKIGYVFLKRKINLLPFVQDENLGADLYDIITPSYGYGGPLGTIDNEYLIKQFREEFEEYCQRENIICEFIRFHPLLQNQKYMVGVMDVVYDRETVFMDLTKSDEDIFRQYHKNHQRNIKKAFRNELDFKVFSNDSALEIVDDFYKLYKGTMDKLNASAYSYFSTEYLRSLLTDLCDQSVIGAIFLKDKMIAAALCMYEGDSLHYHLGCSEKQYLNLGGNVLLLHQLALWGKKAGLQKFHLGGGHIGRDSLFQYKYRFHTNGLLPFYVGRKVLSPEKYKMLAEKWEQYYGGETNKNFFPVYRNMPMNLLKIDV